jgi:DNA gyrase subunit A
VLANISPLEEQIRSHLKYERFVHPVRFLNLLPLSHVFGQFLGMFLPPLMAGTVVFQETLKPAEVIKTIRAAADPDIASTELQTKFGLSERQAKAVLALTLGRLTRLERGKIDAEYEEVIKTIAYLESILASDQKVRLLIKDEMDDLTKKYGDERRTEITDQEASELSAEDLVPKEEVVVTLTHRGYVKRQPLRVFRAQKRGGVGLKGAKPTAGSDAPSGTREEDYALHLLTTHTHASMLFFTQSGRVFQLRVHEMPERERQAKGVPVNNLIDIGSNERITAVFVRPETETEAHYMLMVTKNGYIKKTALAEYANVRRNGLIAINLQQDDELDWVTPTTGSDEILIATELGKAIRFSETEVRASGGALVNAVVDTIASVKDPAQ